MKNFMIWWVSESYNCSFGPNLGYCFVYDILASIYFQVASGRSFDSRDYMAATPSWSVYGSEEGGFDPGQLRYRKERHHKSTRNQAG